MCFWLVNGLQLPLGYESFVAKRALEAIGYLCSCLVSNLANGTRISHCDWDVVGYLWAIGYMCFCLVNGCAVGYLWAIGYLWGALLDLETLGHRDYSPGAFLDLETLGYWVLLGLVRGASLGLETLGYRDFPLRGCKVGVDKAAAKGEEAASRGSLTKRRAASAGRESAKGGVAAPLPLWLTRGATLLPVRCFFASHRADSKGRKGGVQQLWLGIYMICFMEVRNVGVQELAIGVCNKTFKMLGYKTYFSTKKEGRPKWTISPLQVWKKDWKFIPTKKGRTEAILGLPKSSRQDKCHEVKPLHHKLSKKCIHPLPMRVYRCYFGIKR